MSMFKQLLILFIGSLLTAIFVFFITLYLLNKYNPGGI